MRKDNNVIYLVSFRSFEAAAEEERCEDTVDETAHETSIETRTKKKEKKNRYLLTLLSL